MAKYHPGMFMRYSPLKSRTWIRDLDSESRAIFARLGYVYAVDISITGGKARAKTALRDRHGRFIRKERRLKMYLLIFWNQTRQLWDIWEYEDLESLLE